MHKFIKLPNSYHSNFALEKFKSDVWAPATEEEKDLACTLSEYQVGHGMVLKSLLIQSIQEGIPALFYFLYEKNNSGVKNVSTNKRLDHNNSFINCLMYEERSVGREEIFDFIWEKFSDEEKEHVIKIKNHMGGYYYWNVANPWVAEKIWASASPDLQRELLLNTAKFKNPYRLAPLGEQFTPDCKSWLYAIQLLVRVVELNDDKLNRAYIQAIRNLTYVTFSGTPYANGAELIKAVIAAGIEKSVKDQVVGLMLDALRFEKDQAVGHHCINQFLDLLKDEEFKISREKLTKLDNWRIDQVMCDPRNKNKTYQYIHKLEHNLYTDPNHTVIDRLFDEQRYDVLKEFFQEIADVCFTSPSIQARYLERLAYGEDGAVATEKDALIIALINSLEKANLNKEALIASFFQPMFEALKKEYNEDECNWTHFSQLSVLSKKLQVKFAKFLCEKDLRFVEEITDSIKLSYKNGRFYKAMFNEFVLIDLQHDETTEDVPVESFSSEEIDNHTEEHKSEERSVDAEENYFSVKNWKVNKESILNNLLGEEGDSHAVSRALDHLASHARWALTSRSTSKRAEAGLEKYKALQDLFENLSSTDSLDTALADLQNILDNDPQNLPLLQNRGGFGGLYEKVGEILGKRGLFHFHYDHNGNSHNAVSKTDHYLIELYDAITAKRDEESLDVI